ncbi:MAG: hypothetical protein LBJ36_01740 [Synergistaceae bacterium]|jgi:hypothetical protein|nr:hypothetical protein [Synergistaceae bacterium]
MSTEDMSTTQPAGAIQPEGGQTTQTTSGEHGQTTPKSAGSLLLEGIDGGDDGERATPPKGEPKEGEQEKQDEKKTEPETEAKPLTREDITLPEGTTYDEDSGKSFLDIVNDTSISRKDLTQKLVNLYVDQQKKMLESFGAANDAQMQADLAKWNEEIKGWQTAAKADSEYGGQKWEASKAVIARGCDYLATPEAAQLLAEYRLNAHPEILRMFYKAGKLVGEDSTRGATGTAAPSPGDGLLAMYRKSLKL